MHLKHIFISSQEKSNEPLTTKDRILFLKAAGLGGKRGVRSPSNPWRRATEATFLNIKPTHVLFDFLVKFVNVGREIAVPVSELKITAPPALCVALC